MKLRFELTKDVDRYPHALVPAGTKGTLTHYEKPAEPMYPEMFSRPTDTGEAWIQLDEKNEGLAEWDNELHFPDLDEFEDCARLIDG